MPVFLWLTLSSRMSIMTDKSTLRSSTILFPVFIPAVVVSFLLIVGTISDPERAGEAFSAAQAWITANFGWFYMLAVALFLIFIVGVAMTRWGNIKPVSYTHLTLPTKA